MNDDTQSPHIDVYPKEPDPTNLYVVTFERLGRTLKNYDVQFQARNERDLAEQVHRFARKHLASRQFSTLVDLDAMRGSIEAGRYGRFTISDRGPINV